MSCSPRLLRWGLLTSLCFLEHLTYISFSGVVERLLCHRCGDQPRITADMLVNLQDCDRHGEANSNERRLSEEVAENLESFLNDCEGNICALISLVDQKQQ